MSIEIKEREERKMTIRELREMLEQFDDDMRVQIVDNHWNEDIDDVDEYDGIVIIRA